MTARSVVIRVDTEAFEYVRRQRQAAQIGGRGGQEGMRACVRRLVLSDLRAVADERKPCPFCGGKVGVQ